MYDPLGLSIGTTNLVAVRKGNPPVTRRAVLTVFPDRAPELGVPVENPDVVDTGTLMAGFVERVGGSSILKSADGSTHDPALLLVEALDALITATGGEAATSNITMAVPAHWGPEALRGLQDALSTHSGFVRSGVAPRLVSDAVAALTALNSNSRLPANGVVALFDFGGGGTSITLADAASDFAPIAQTLRYSEFSGDVVDQALLVHALDNAGHSNGADPASTAVVGQFASLREECRLAKEQLSSETVTELIAELPGRRARVEVTRADLDSLIEGRLDGLLVAFDDLLRRNKLRRRDLAAVAMAGGGAKIPFVAQRLSSSCQGLGGNRRAARTGDGGRREDAVGRPADRAARQGTRRNDAGRSGGRIDRRLRHLEQYLRCAHRLTRFPHGHIRCSDGHVPGSHRWRVLRPGPVGDAA